TPVLIFIMKINYQHIFKYGGCGEAVNAPDCGSGTRGFESHQPPHLYLLGYSQAVRHRVLIPSFLGSNPSSPANCCGSSSVVEHHLAKVGVAGSNPVFRLDSFLKAAQPSGKAEDCKSSTTGSNPVAASRLFNICQYGGIGRRARLKILFLLGVSVRSRLLVLDKLQIIDVLTVFKTC